MEPAESIVDNALFMDVLQYRHRWSSRMFTYYYGQSSAIVDTCTVADKSVSRNNLLQVLHLIMLTLMAREQNYITVYI